MGKPKEVTVKLPEDAAAALLAWLAERGRAGGSMGTSDNKLPGKATRSREKTGSKLEAPYNGSAMAIATKKRGPGRPRTRFRHMGIMVSRQAWDYLSSEKKRRVEDKRKDSSFAAIIEDALAQAANK